MTSFQQIPIFADVAQYFAYPVKQTPLVNYVQLTAAGASQFGSITLRPQVYFMVFGLTAFSNYDNVAPVVRTANSNAILAAPFTPNNFTVKIDRGNNNKYSNLPVPQALLCSAGYRAGKVFPDPVVYGPRSNFQFTVQDTTGLFLLTATSGGTAVPLNVQLFLEGFNIPIDCWDKFSRIYPDLAANFGAAPGL